MKQFFNFLIMLILCQSLTIKANNESVQALIQTRKAPCATLDGINLIDLDLSKIDIRGAKIRNAAILRVNLNKSDLRNVDAENSSFFGSILIDTKFNGAKLKGVQDLHRAIYRKCASFPINWLKWQHDKDQLDLQQLAKLLSDGHTICQADYSPEELEQLRKFNVK